MEPKNIDHINNAIDFQRKKNNCSQYETTTQLNYKPIELTKKSHVPKSKSSKKRRRCSYKDCNKKLKLTDTKCRCTFTFCSKHKFFSSHNCTYDYKTEERKILAQQNPTIKASKLTDI
tara:strand:- start:27 stop:380 length:354 start_codon:yes stop_codon:yes gene_type:complete